MNADSNSLGYKCIRAKDGERKLRVWEAARCTTAAPWFFTPKQLDSIGTFQDGGLHHNNPVNIALWESRRIWPDAPTDIVLSIGTGSGMEVEPGSPTSTGPRGILRDGFIPRLYRSFMSSLDGQKAWTALMNRLNIDTDSPQSKYFRLNVRFNGPEPHIDETR